MSNENQFLVVDHFASMRRVVADQLRELGYSKIQEAENSAHAIESLASREGEKAIDCIIAGWQSIAADGIPLLRQLRKAAALRDIAILAIVADPRIEDIMAAEDAGVADYLFKPFSSAALGEKLNRILKKKGLKP